MAQNIGYPNYGNQDGQPEPYNFGAPAQQYSPRINRYSPRWPQVTEPANPYGQMPQPPQPSPYNQLNQTAAYTGGVVGPGAVNNNPFVNGYRQPAESRVAANSTSSAYSWVSGFDSTTANGGGNMNRGARMRMSEPRKTPSLPQHQHNTTPGPLDTGFPGHFEYTLSEPWATPKSYIDPIGSGLGGVDATMTTAEQPQSPFFDSPAWSPQYHGSYSAASPTTLYNSNNPYALTNSGNSLASNFGFQQGPDNDIPINGAPGSYTYTASQSTNSHLKQAGASWLDAVPPFVPEDLKRVRDYFTELFGTKRKQQAACPHVNENIATIIYTIKTEERKKSPSLYTQTGNTCSIKCQDPECKGIVCLGCREKIGNFRNSRALESHSCVHSHFMSAVVVLARIDARWLLKELPQSNSASKDQTPANPIPGFSRPFHGSTNPRGVGYGDGNYGRVTNYKRPAKSAAKLRQESEDNKCLANLLKALSALLTEKPGDYSVISLLAERGAILTSTIKVTFLPEIIQSLVRNDSIMDIDAADTWDLYTACMELLRAFSEHEPLLDLLVSPLQEKKSSPGLANLIRVPEKTSTYPSTRAVRRVGLPKPPNPVDFAIRRGIEGLATPIIQSLEKLVKQCQAFMNNATRVQTGDDEDTQKLLAFCIDVDGTAIHLNRRAEALKLKKEASRPQPTSAMTNAHLASLPSEMLAHPLFANSRSFMAPVAPRSPFEIPQDIISECKKALTSHLQFKFSAEVAKTHAASAPVQPYGVAAVATAPHPGRMKRLIKELTVLSTTLPEGIFVRVQEDKPELLKALIIGPQSTPYHLGLYEFDFTIPNDYPNSPPSVSFKTTGGGTVRFNPNLYQCVCLSILGTWDGAASEKWQAGKSTLLQVLVSIQAMILCEEPYYNEPGYQNNANPTASKNYNENVQLQSMRYAMNEWLSHDGLWSDVVQNHFLSQTPEILTTTAGFVATGTDGAPDPSNDWSFVVQPGSVAFNGGVVSAGNSSSSTKSAMQTARDDLQNNMKNKLPIFLKAEPWKEKAES
ncbi:hypothetical protein ABW19_dt0209934 [Dactylella cylindrospora]|nr:hypothetical protein ABW19_dt0209934 [Dactylella cylindrospora]